LAQLGPSQGDRNWGKPDKDFAAVEWMIDAIADRRLVQHRDRTSAHQTIRLGECAKATLPLDVMVRWFDLDG
jgi:hypothetical protein